MNKDDYKIEIDGTPCDVQSISSQQVICITRPLRNTKPFGLSNTGCVLHSDCTPQVCDFNSGQCVVCSNQNICPQGYNCNAGTCTNVTTYYKVQVNQYHLLMCAYRVTEVQRDFIIKALVDHLLGLE